MNERLPLLITNVISILPMSNIRYEDINDLLFTELDKIAKVTEKYEGKFILVNVKKGSFFYQRDQENVSYYNIGVIVKIEYPKHSITVNLDLDNKSPETATMLIYDNSQNSSNNKVRLEARERVLIKNIEFNDSTSFWEADYSIIEDDVADSIFPVSNSLIQARISEISRNISNGYTLINPDFIQNILQETSSIRRWKLAETLIESIGTDEDSSENKAEEVYKKLLKGKDIPSEFRTKLLEEIPRLSNYPFSSLEYSLLKTYLDIACSLPWSGRSSKIDIVADDIKKIKESLENTHYGLDKVKMAILLYFASLTRKVIINPSRVMCLVGPPGVGKTSILGSVAKSLGKKLVKISVASMQSALELKGHERTYVGSAPGKIIEALRNNKTENLLIVLDEIDKISDIAARHSGSGVNGALLELLDNKRKFFDNYLGCDYDLSNVLFAATANNESNISVELTDRLEIIELPSYTNGEKEQISRMIIRSLVDEYGLGINFTKKTIYDIINFYTFEAGVRQLSRELSKIFEKIRYNSILHPEKKIPNTVISSELNSYLGVPKYKNIFNETSSKEEKLIGRANGLGYNILGGSVISMEACKFKKTNVSAEGFIITGNVLSEMKESCNSAISYLKSESSKFKIPEGFFSEYYIHVNLPGGGRKDGGSAGIVLTSLILSIITDTPISSKIAMTGEISVQGRVMPIGKLREKLTGASRAGIKKVIIPFDNRDDLEDVPKEILSSLKIFIVKNFLDVWNILTQTE